MSSPRLFARARADLFRSSLDDTMRSAYNLVRKAYLSRSAVDDLRTAGLRERRGEAQWKQ